MGTLGTSNVKPAGRSARTDVIPPSCEVQTSQACFTISQRGRGTYSPLRAAPLSHVTAARAGGVPVAVVAWRWLDSVGDRTSSL
jgi:hypothetical protein